MKNVFVLIICIAAVSCSSPKKQLISKLDSQKKRFVDSLNRILLLQNQFNVKAGIEENAYHGTLKYYPLVDSTEKYFSRAKDISAQITAIGISIDGCIN